ncbi:O-antigen ligase family protein [Pelagibius sp. CAU 1746]|uniref:O-antigen ligase family protein n=1 Tax=Pelagibius sp. CAU 1746 TaxID=3140370 RepID=UPI00325B5A35
MTTAPESLRAETARRARLGLLLACFALLLTPLALLADKAVVPLVLATAAAGGLLLGTPALPWRIVDRPLALCLGLLTGWCLIASAWSFDAADAAKLAARIGLLLFALLYLTGLTRFLDAAQRRRVALGFCLGFAATLLLVVVELAFQSPLLTLLRGPLAGDYATYSRLNRGISALAVLTWPLALLAWQQQRRAVALALPPAVLALTLFSESSASMVALAAGLLAAALAAWSRGAARLVLVLAIAGALFAAPLVVEVVQQADLERSRIIPETGQYRLHIWSVVSERFSERPIFGWGFDSSPALPAGDAQPFRTGGKIIPSHPHNGGLQILVELGLIGGLMTLGLLAVVAGRIDRLAPAQRSAAAAMTVTLLGIACTAYGIWQSHWLSVIGAAAAIFVALLPAPEEASSVPPPRS